jgi:hypothetical protein
MSEVEMARIEILDRNQEKMFEKLDAIADRLARIEEGMKGSRCDQHYAELKELRGKVEALTLKVVGIATTISTIGSGLVFFFK